MNKPPLALSHFQNWSRRDLLRKGLLSAMALRLVAASPWLCVAQIGFAATAEVPETEDNPEGPFYKPDAPFRSVLLERGLSGTPLTLRGQVSDTRGRSVKGALLDIWHANATGVYDNHGFTWRGRLRTDESGCYELRTIKPKGYGADGDFRPAHIHVKASAPGVSLLTTEIYFKGDPYNATDPWVRPSLMISPHSASDGLEARFDFVLKAV